MQHRRAGGWLAAAAGLAILLTSVDPVPGGAAVAGARAEPAPETPAGREREFASPAPPPVGGTSPGREAPGAIGEMLRQTDPDVDAEREADWRTPGATGGRPGFESSEYREVEQALVAAGFDPGEVDGILDVRARSAIRRFQQARGLPVTGQLNRETRDALRVAGGRERELSDQPGR